MSALLSVTEVAAHALREIGELSVYDSGPDPVALQVAVERLDLLIAELVGTEGIWWLRPFQLSLPLIQGQQFVALAALGTQFQFFTHASLIATTDSPPVSERPVKLISQQMYDAIPEKGFGGDPDMACIQRQDSPQAALYPVPARDGLVLRLSGQAYAADLTVDHGAVDHGFPAAWQRWMVTRLAVDIGGGAVRTIPPADRQEKREEAARTLALLLARNNRANIDRPRAIQPYLP